MKIKHLLSAIVAFCFAVCATAQQSPQVVYLKNGTIIHGDVIEYQLGGIIKIKNVVGDVFVYQADEVERIMKKEVDATATSSRTPVLKGQGSPARGYRGFLDCGLSFGKVKAEGIEFSWDRFGIMTSHGFQFNPHAFIGGGWGLQFKIDDEAGYLFDAILPFFVDFRFDLADKRVSPFFDIRSGGFASLTPEEEGEALSGLYDNINFGVRVRRLNISVGYELMVATASTYYKYKIYDISTTANSFVVRLGVDFGRRN